MTIGTPIDLRRKVSVFFNLAHVTIIIFVVAAMVKPSTAEDTISSDAGASLQMTEISEFENPGNLRMFVYVPESVRVSSEPRPLVVALHGCAMTAEDYFLPTGWGLLAQNWNFALLLPEQPKATSMFDMLKGKNNPARCFQWWRATRGNPEVKSIMNMISVMLDKYGSSLDPSRIYVTGVSAGGGMAVNLMALHPACFAGGAPIAGIPFNCAEGSVNQAILDCMKPTDEPGARPRQSLDEGGKNYSPEKWGNWVRRECNDHNDCPSYNRGWPRISIWQGAQDRMVGPGNMRDLRRQWTKVHQIDEIPDAEALRPADPYVVEHKVYADRAGRVHVETWLIGEEGEATDHGVVIDPEEPTFQCGRKQEFIYDGNICSSLEIARFWSLDGVPHPPRVGGRCSYLR